MARYNNSELDSVPVRLQEAMSVKREKVCHDPLSGLLATSCPEAEHEPTIAPPRKPHTHNLKNTLTGGEDDFMKFEPKEQTQRKVASSKSTQSPTAVASTTCSSSVIHTEYAGAAPAPKPVLPKKPTGPTSVFESGDDVFLMKGDTGMSADAQRSLEDELFGPSATPLGALSTSSSATTRRTGHGRFTTSYEDSFDEKVCNAMCRYALDLH